jgi:hypothetical protein
MLVTPRHSFYSRKERLLALAFHTGPSDNILAHRRSLCIVVPPASYFEGIYFDYCSRDLVSRLKDFVMLHSFSRQMVQQRFKQATITSFHIPSSSLCTAALSRDVANRTQNWQNTAVHVNTQISRFLVISTQPCFKTTHQCSSTIKSPHPAPMHFISSLSYVQCLGSAYCSN